MPLILEDLGQTMVVQTDDGRQVEVAKPFAEQYLPPPAPIPGPGDAGPPLGAEQLPTPLSPALAAPPPQDGPGALLPPPEPPQPASAPQAPAPAPEPSQAAEPAYAPPAAPQAPRTAMQAAQAGIQGLEQQQAAAQRAGAAESQGQAEIARVYDVAQQDIAREEAAREKFLAARQAREAELLAEKQSLTEKWANHKVDRNRRWNSMTTGDKVWAAIGMALSAMGNALTARQETSLGAVDMLMAGIEQDVADQMADRDRMGQQIGLKQGEIADFRSVSQTRAAEFATRMAAKTEWLSREVAKVGARTQSAAVKANADALIGQLQAQKAQLLQGAVTADRSAEDARKARALQASAQAETKRHNMATEGIQRDELVAQTEIARLKAQKDLPKPGQVSGNTVHGIKLRAAGPDGKETTLDSVEVENKETAKYLNEILDSAKQKMKRLDDIKAIGPGRNLVRDEDKAIIQSAMAGIRIAEQQLIPGQPSDKDAAIISKSIGMDDPSKFWELLDADERQRVLDYVGDVTVRQTNDSLQQRLGPGASWSHTPDARTTKALPQEPETPDEIRARMVKSSGGPVTATPVTNKRSSYSTPFIKDARAAVKSDKDPKSLLKTKALVVQEIAKLEFVPSKENVEAANELRKMAAEIDAKMADITSKEEALRRNEPAAERKRLDEAARVMGY